MKAKDAENASKIEAEVKAQYSGHNSPDDIVISLLLILV